MRSFSKYLYILLSLVFPVSCGTDFDSDFCPTLNNCVSSGGGTTSSVYSTIFSDDYNRADGGVGASYASITDGGTTLGITSSEVRLGRNNISGVTPVAFYNSNLAHKDVRITLDFRVTGTLAAGNGFAGIYARSQSNSDTLNSYECRLNTIDGKLDVFVYNGGAPTLLVSSAVTAPFNNGDAYQIIFTLEETSLQCEVTGSATISVSTTDSSHSSGFYGGMGGIENAVEIYMDDFLIEGRN